MAYYGRGWCSDNIPFFFGGWVLKCGIFSAAERGFGAVVFESNGHGAREREVRERRRVMKMGLGFGWDEAEILMRESGVVFGVLGIRQSSFFLQCVCRLYDTD